MASVALAGVAVLAGCNTDDVSQVVSARALKPLPAALAAEIDKRNMPRESPILVRVFKEESELEVWKQDTEGRFQLLKTYPICRWSGELGPKVKEGDRQAPEGFYNITPGQMNPNSNYYLAFNLGFPNAFDRANERTGAFLMVHGDCSSAGCYAMTDEQIQEIYALGRDSFLGGQKSFQVQAYPFRMTPLNMAKHRNSPHMAFWRMIKEGNDHFEVTRAEPHVDVCEKRYVFDGRTPANASTPISFHAKDKCPVYEVPADLAAAVKEKHDKDERAFTEHVNRGVATVAVRTGTDGGMHPAFLAKLQPKTVFDFQTGRTEVRAPDGPLPPNVNPPHAPDPDTTSGVADASQSSESGLRKVGRWLGFGATETAESAGATAAPAVAKPKATPTAAPKPVVAAKPQQKSPTEVAQAAPQQASSQQASPQPASSQQASAQPAPPSPFPNPPATTSGLMAGATPVVPAGTFGDRWGAMR
jgi:murein L,D-transpeptidase YafK